MINTAVLTGRLTKDVDLKYTQGGTAVGNFNLAVNRNFKDKNGEREADFINCVIWRKSAENLAKFVNKGSLIGIEGRLQTRNYENNNGQKVFVTEVVVNTFSLLEPNNNNQQNNSQNTNNQQSDPFVNSGNQVDIDDDDLPF